MTSLIIQVKLTLFNKLQTFTVLFLGILYERGGFEMRIDGLTGQTIQKCKHFEANKKIVTDFCIFFSR